MNRFGKLAFRTSVMFFLLIISSNVVSIAVAMGELEQPSNLYGIPILFLIGLTGAVMSEWDNA